MRWIKPHYRSEQFLRYRILCHGIRTKHNGSVLDEYTPPHLARRFGDNGIPGAVIRGADGSDPVPGNYYYVGCFLIYQGIKYQIARLNDTGRGTTRHNKQNREQQKKSE